VSDLNSRAPQNLKAFARVFQIRIRRTGDNFFNSGGDDGLCARRRATVRATWFERNVKRRAARICVRVFARRGAPRFPHAANQRVGAKPRPMILPPFTSSAPTIGFGEVAP